MVSTETFVMAKAAENVSPLKAHLGYWLRFVSNHVSGAFAEKVEGEGVSVAEWVVLRELFEAERLPSEVAKRIGMTRGAISKIADRLLAKGLIASKTDKDDRRYQPLFLTRAGKALVPKLARLADKNDAEFFDHLTKAEQATLEKLMRGIIARRGLTSVPIS
jgi:DNA-binding MarR family transcriptional regulator